MQPVRALARPRAASPSVRLSVRAPVYQSVRAAVHPAGTRSPRRRGDPFDTLARAAEAGQFRLAVLGPDRECRRGATLAAAATARRLPYYSLDMPCDVPPPGVAGDLRARTAELQRIFDALVGALLRPARHSVAELENMTICR